MLVVISVLKCLRQNECECRRIARVSIISCTGRSIRRRVCEASGVTPQHTDNKEFPTTLTILLAGGHLELVLSIINDGHVWNRQTHGHSSTHTVNDPQCISYSRFVAVLAAGNETELKRLCQLLHDPGPYLERFLYELIMTKLLDDNTRQVLELAHCNTFHALYGN